MPRQPRPPQIDLMPYTAARGPSGGSYAAAVAASVGPPLWQGSSPEEWSEWQQTSAASQGARMRPRDASPLGERVTLDGAPFGDAGLPQDWQGILNPKRKVEPKLLEKLTTNGGKEGLFNGVKMMTAAGPILAKSIVNGVIS